MGVATRMRICSLGSKIAWLCLLIIEARACNLGSYNLTQLETYSPWQARNDFFNITYSISLCRALVRDDSTDAHNCEDGTAVCGVYDNGTAVSFGKHQNDPVLSEDGDDTEMMLLLRGEPCPLIAGENYTTIFHFKCGKTLGFPHYLGDLGCSVNIEWCSLVFCNDLHLLENEVPCAVLSNGHLIDLTPLALPQGAHLVAEFQNKKVFINVCKDIYKAKTTTDGSDACPQGTAACRVVDGVGQDYGRATRQLEATSDGVKLVYTSPMTPAGCISSPTTIVHFRCPQRGGSKDPVLLSDSACSLEIDWLTEFACPVDHVSSDTRRLTDQQHDVDIDLSPLSRDHHRSKDRPMNPLRYRPFYNQKWWAALPGLRHTSEETLKVGRQWEEGSGAAVRRK